MSEDPSNDDLLQKKKEIDKEKDGLQKVAKLLELLSFSLHEKKSLFAFFKVKKWILDEFELGFKNKELMQKFKILEEEGCFFKKKQIKEGDFAIEQMQIALDDLKESLLNPSMGIKQTLLPRILLNIKPKQIVEDLRALRFLSKIRIRLFDFQKELGALNATLSKKKEMFSFFREFSKEVNHSRDDLLKKIIHKIEGSLFKDLQKKICLKTRFLKDEGQALILIAEIKDLQKKLEAMRLNMSYIEPSFKLLHDCQEVVQISLDKQKKMYLENRDSQQENKIIFENKIEKQKDLRELLQEVHRSNLYIELKRELIDKIHSQIKVRDKTLSEQFIALQDRQKEHKIESENKSRALLEAMQETLKKVDPTESLFQVIKLYSSKRSLLQKRLDRMKFDRLLVQLHNCAFSNQNANANIEQWQELVQKTKREYKEIRSKGSLTFEESLELNEILQGLKESQRICHQLQELKI